MVKYKVNLKFKDTPISLNKIITKALKIELENMFNISYNYLNRDLPYNNTNYFQVEESNN